MKLVIIAHSLKVAGGKSVAINTIKSLLKLYPNNEYLLFLPLDSDFCDIAFSKKCHVHYFSSVNFIGRILYDFFYLKKHIYEFEPDVIWGLGNIGLSKPPCKQVILLHKAQLVCRYPMNIGESYLNRIKNFILKKNLKICLRQTQLVFCQTDVMKNHFINSFSYGGKVSLFPNAISTSVDREDKDIVRSIQSTYNGKKRLLVLARYYPHKNLELLVQCFNVYRNELKDVVCFITINETGHKNASKFINLIDKYDLKDNIVNLGPLAQSELANYYKACDALLLPTLLESFSGTYIEAMQFETPIITSDLDFAREICQDSAIYFDPYCIKSLMQKLREFYDSEDISIKLIAEGRRQLNTYVRSWDEIVNNGMHEILEIVKCGNS